MGNQSGTPENIVSFPTLETGQAKSAGFGGAIINFQNPNLGKPEPVGISPTNIIEGLLTDPEAKTEIKDLSKAEIRAGMLHMALHPAEKAA